MGTSADTIWTSRSNEKINRDTNQTNRDIANDTNAANLELAEKQNQWNIDQWNRTNEYNSPLAEVERLKAAGLNPNLYGQGTGQYAENIQSAELANQQTGAPMQPYQVENPYAEKIARWQAIMANIDQIMKIPQNHAKVQETLSNVRKNYSDVGMNDSQIALNTGQMRQLNENIRLTLQKQVTEGLQQNLLRSQAQKNSADSELSFAQSEFLRNTTPTNQQFSDRYNAETAHVFQNINESQKRVQLMGVEIGKEQALSLLYGEQMRKIGSDIGLNHAQQTNLEAELGNIVKRGDLLNQEFQIGQCKYSIVQNEAHQVEVRTELLDNASGVANTDAANVVRYVYEYLNAIATYNPMTRPMTNVVSNDTR